jgi:hypothetical protein
MHVQETNFWGYFLVTSTSPPTPETIKPTPETTKPTPETTKPTLETTKPTPVTTETPDPESQSFLLKCEPDNSAGKSNSVRCQEH